MVEAPHSREAEIRDEAHREDLRGESGADVLTDAHPAQ